MKTSHRPAIFASQYIGRIVSSEHSMCQIRLLYTKYATVSKDITIHPYIISKSKLLSSGYKIPYPNVLQSIVSPCRSYSEKDSCPNNYKETASNENPSQKTKTDQFKKAIKDYGSTVIIFHVAITLASFGFFYLLVSSGIDVVRLVAKLPYVGENLSSSSLAAGASTFVIAYAVHKLFVPVRMSITLTACPFLVKFLRIKGFLK